MKTLILIYICLFSILVQSAWAKLPGFSGMEQINTDTYLVVIDKKAHKDGSRVGLLKTEVGGKLNFSPLQISNWSHSDGQASDLESVCRIPGKTNEYLLAEAGYWEGKYGRIFHIEISGIKASVKNVYRIPKIVGGAKGIDGDNFEGMVCFKNGNSTLVVLGERGGSSLYRNGYLRIGVLNYLNSSLSWDDYADKSLEIAAPGNWNNSQSKRSISDLYIDKNGVIWAVATEDAGDGGPFKSIIYKAAMISNELGSYPIKAIHSKKAYWTIDGFKIEALAGPSGVVPGSYMSIGTEDESYDGVWRPLFPPVE